MPTMGEHEWAELASSRVQKAVDEFNAGREAMKGPTGKPLPLLRIVWGYPDKDTEREEQAIPARYRHTEALINWLDHDYQLSLHRSGDPDYPDHCDITTDFPGWPGIKFDGERYLPLGDARRLYNAFRSCGDGVSLRLFPEKGDEPGIQVFGTTARLPVETITPRVLHATLAELRESTERAWRWLSRGRGDDWQDQDKGDDYWKLGL
jgi:hypothetical protein